MRVRMFLIAAIALGAVTAIMGASSLAIFTDSQDIDANTFTTGTLDISASPATSVVSFTNMAPGDIATGSTHGDTQITGSQSGGIIDTVAHDRDVVLFFLELMNQMEFFLGQTLGLDFRAAHLSSNALCHCQSIAGDHHQSFSAELCQLTDSIAGLLTGTVFHPDPPDTAIVLGDIE